MKLSKQWVGQTLLVRGNFPDNLYLRVHMRCMNYKIEFRILFSKYNLLQQILCKSPFLCQICSQLGKNQTSKCMRSAFSTLYPGDSCDTKCHSCCSVVRGHERRIAGLEQALDSLRRGIKKVFCLVACILCFFLIYHSKILQLY